MRKQTRIENMIFCSKVIHNFTDIVLQSPEIQNIIHSNDEYDLVMGHLFYLDAFLAFAHKFKAPLIGLSAQNIITHYGWLFGYPISPSYIPNAYLPMTEKMTFIERVINTGFDMISSKSKTCRISVILT